MTRHKKWFSYFSICTLLVVIPTMVSAVPLDDFLRELEGLAKKESSSFTGFSAKRGERFYFTEFLHPEAPTVRSCATCHTKDITQTGSHYKSGKKIDPLSPATNPARLEEVKKVRKWFRRNCKWVLQRACSPLEKGDFLTFLQTR